MIAGLWRRAHSPVHAFSGAGSCSAEIRGPAERRACDTLLCWACTAGEVISKPARRRRGAGAGVAGGGKGGSCQCTRSDQIRSGGARSDEVRELLVKLVDAEALADAAQLRHILGDRLHRLDLLCLCVGVVCEGVVVGLLGGCSCDTNSATASRMCPFGVSVQCTGDCESGGH